MILVAVFSLNQFNPSHQWFYYVEHTICSKVNFIGGLLQSFYIINTPILTPQPPQPALFFLQSTSPLGIISPEIKFYDSFWTTLSIFIIILLGEKSLAPEHQIFEVSWLDAEQISSKTV